MGSAKTQQKNSYEKKTVKVPVISFKEVIANNIAIAFTMQQHELQRLSLISILPRDNQNQANKNKKGTYARSLRVVVI